MNQFIKGIKQLPKALKRSDKLTLAFLAVIIIATAGLWWTNTSSHWLTRPAKGGVYTEGIVTTSPQDVDLITTKLTKIGLTYVDLEGKTKGALADKWDISADGKQYTFHLRNGVDAAKIADTYSSLPAWQDITVTPSDHQLTVTLKQPFGLLLSFTSEPVVDAGPYTVDKQSKTQIIYDANKKFILGEPNIQKIVINFYLDDKSMEAALQRQEILGADLPFANIAGTSIKSLKLTKQDVLLFNLDRDIFKDVSVRQKIVNNQKLPQPIKATLVTSQDPELLDIANDFATRAKKIGLTVSINSVNDVALQRDYLANDNYDIILTTLNYGYDQDPYPYWHSSQILNNGQNYANYRNKDVDVAIEQARQTTDQGQRQKLYQQIFQMINTDAPGIFYPNEVFKYTLNNRVKGVTNGTGAVPTDRYTEVWKWYLKAKKSPH